MRYPIRGNLALKEEFTDEEFTDIDIQDASATSARRINFPPALFKEKSEGFLGNTEHPAILSPKWEMITIVETGNPIFDEELFTSQTGVELVRERFVLRDSNLMDLDSRLSRYNNHQLVDEFMRTLRYALLSTVAIKGDEIDKLILRGDILSDTTNLSDPFSIDIELFIVLNVESYILSDILVELADNIYGEILGKKGIFFINTVLSQTEWDNMVFDQDEHFILMEKESVLQESLYENQLSTS